MTLSWNIFPLKIPKAQLTKPMTSCWESFWKNVFPRLNWAILKKIFGRSPDQLKKTVRKVVGYCLEKMFLQGSIEQSWKKISGDLLINWKNSKKSCWVTSLKKCFCKAQLSNPEKSCGRSWLNWAHLRTVVGRCLEKNGFLGSIEMFFWTFPEQTGLEIISKGQEKKLFGRMHRRQAHSNAQASSLILRILLPSHHLGVSLHTLLSSAPFAPEEGTKARAKQSTLTSYLFTLAFAGLSRLRAPPRFVSENHSRI